MIWWFRSLRTGWFTDSNSKCSGCTQELQHTCHSSRRYCGWPWLCCCTCSWSPRRLHGDQVTNTTLFPICLIALESIFSFVSLSGTSLVWRFLATPESYAHPLYKQKIVEAGYDSTEYTHMYGRGRWPGAAHRVLKSPFFENWKNKIAPDETEIGQPIIGSTTTFHNVSHSTTLISFRILIIAVYTLGFIHNFALYPLNVCNRRRRCQDFLEKFPTLQHRVMWIVWSCMLGWVQLTSRKSSQRQLWSGVYLRRLKSLLSRGFMDFLKPNLNTLQAQCCKLSKIVDPYILQCLVKCVHNKVHHGPPWAQISMADGSVRLVTLPLRQA